MAKYQERHEEAVTNMLPSDADGIGLQTTIKWEYETDSSTMDLYQKLEKLQNLEPHVILLELNELLFRLIEMLDNVKQDPDTLLQFLKILSQALKTNKPRPEKLRVIEVLLETKLFTLHIPTYIRTTLIHSQNGDIFHNLLVIFRVCLRMKPVVAAKNLYNCVKFCASVVEWPALSRLPVDVKKTFIDIACLLEETSGKTSNKENKTTFPLQDEAGGTDEPTTFRKLPVIPTADEITINQKPFLSENIVSGQYRNVNHYLDFHFRLLRENYVAPLRTAISEHVSDTMKKRYPICVYCDVKIGAPIYKTNGIFYTLFINVDSAMQNFGSQACHQLMVGSLLCLSADNFHTLMYATVSHRELNKLKHGKLVVKFERECNKGLELNDCERSQTYEIMELPSCTRFDAHKNALKGLQQISDETMPLKQYIVYNERHMFPPQYLDHNAIYNLSCLSMRKTCGQVAQLHVKIKQKFKNLAELPIDQYSDTSQICVLDFRKWPSNEELSLDNSQRRTLHFALTSSIAVIRGLPGTGKTYLGHALVKTLLNNQNVWNSPSGKTPILLMFSTSLALDQFLGPITSITSRLVRIAGRSKNRSLDRFDISNCFSESKRRNIDELKQALRQLKGKIEEQQAMLQLLGSNIIHESKLCDLTGSDKMLVASLASGYAKVQSDAEDWRPKSFLAAWLGLSFDNLVCEEELEHFLNYPESDCLDLKGKVNHLKTSSLRGTPELAIHLYSGSVADSTNVLVIQDCSKNIENQLDTEESDNIVSRSTTISRDSWALHIPSLENPFDHFPEENSLDVTMLPLYLAMGHARKAIAEREMQNTEELGELLVNSVTDAWLFPLHHRWSLYRRWIAQFRAARLGEIKSLQEEYESTARSIKDVINDGKMVILKECDIIGVTATGAAVYRDLLLKTSSKIAIVQEASEILESSIITSLAPSTEHLVLIGDYPVYRQKIALQEVTKEYGSNVSLFERLIKTGVRHEELEVQHRMRPEISSLISTLIGSELKNHLLVQKYGDIEGLGKNVFFVTHELPCESTNADSELSASQFEAEYVLGLCRYLIQQGYEPENITLLALCPEQHLFLCNLLEKETFAGLLKVSTVPFYQGEENDIVLISFASKNPSTTACSLEQDYNVIKALTRARKGLYCFGNFAHVSSDILHQLAANLVSEKSGNIGIKLELICQNHPNCIRFVACGEDFRHVAPRGGCSLLCSVMQPCGHVCEQMCHLDGHAECTTVEKVFPVCRHTVMLPCSQAISNVKCTAKVERLLSQCGHKVWLPCHYDVRFHKCTVQVTHIFSQCQHQVKVNCSINRETLRCKEDCDYRLDCGHRCPRLCHLLEDIQHRNILCTKPCQKKICERNHKCGMRCCEPCNVCHVMVDKELFCGHKAKVVCHQSVTNVTVLCKMQCKRTLACGHPCRRLCSDLCGYCTVMVEKNVPNCGHTMKIICMSNPERIQCNQTCTKLLICGHMCTGRCNAPCIQQCKQLVTFTTQSCGHTTMIPCNTRHNASTNGVECQAMCGRLLPCEHECKGKCHECRQGRVHVPCSKNGGSIKICGHLCDMPCSQACLPCKHLCLNRCVHSRCRKKCGQPCKRCWEPCVWQCQHFKCDKYCSEFCTRPRCDESCSLLLPCGHPCVGLCGERCPELCRVCHWKELTEFILYGFEEEQGSRFIRLEDCGHCIEVRAMDHWMDMDMEEIQMKGCPRCNTTVWCSLRYGNVIRNRILDVQKVKKHIFGSNQKLKDTVHRLQDVLKTKNCIRDNFQGETVHLNQRLNQHWFSVPHQSKLAVIENQINILEFMVKMKEKTKSMTAKAKNIFLFDLKLLGSRLMQNEEHITEYELNQINCEIRRIFLVAAAKDTEAQIGQRVNARCTEQLTRVKEILAHGCALTLQEEKEIESALETALQLRGGIGISDQERVAIVKAMGFTQGHWFKCPNGHIYAIGECGGAMQVSKCNECGAQIGGQSHTLLSDNALASEMDGSRHAAWPGTANA